jgi:hypothetical protein
MRTGRTALRLVDATSEEAWRWFCGHCGAVPANSQTPAPTARVCRECELGLLLQTRADVLPGGDSAFLVVDSSLSIQAVSRTAELALGVGESDAVNRHIGEFLIPADAEAATPVGLAIAITRAAGGDQTATEVFVRPGNTFGVRLRVRIAACGPPPAALLVLEP